MNKKRLLIAFLTMLLLGLVAIAVVFFQLTALTSTENSTSYLLKVPSGSTARTVAAELKDEGIIRSKTVFYWVARITDFKLQAGRFEVASNLSVFELFEALSKSGDISIKVIIPEGYTVSKIGPLLKENEVITSVSDFINASKDNSILTKYNIPAQSVEGYLFPDTYFLTPEMSSFAVIDVMISTFFDRAEQLGISVTDSQALHDVVKLASIVEREYRVSSEAPLMASVFSNRLRDNVGLESCATIVYILTEVQEKPHPSIITYDDLKIDSEYNTYKWAGLPPGPISNPGMVALEAAANPPKTEYYYFRINNEQLGTHDFTETLSEHAQAGLSFKK